MGAMVKINQNAFKKGVNDALTFAPLRAAIFGGKPQSVSAARSVAPSDKSKATSVSNDERPKAKR